MKARPFLHKLWRITKKVFLVLFIAQLLYIVLLKWVYPPVTMTQLISWVSGHGLKRDYVSRGEISVNARLAVIASEDQRFTEHHGFDWRAIRQAMDHNDKKPNKRRKHHQPAGGKKCFPLAGKKLVP